MIFIKFNGLSPSTSSPSIVNLSTLRSDKLSFDSDSVSAKTLNFPQQAEKNWSLYTPRSDKSTSVFDLAALRSDKLRIDFDSVSVNPLNSVAVSPVKPQSSQQDDKSGIFSKFFALFKSSSKNSKNMYDAHPSQDKDLENRRTFGEREFKGVTETGANSSVKISVQDADKLSIASRSPDDKQSSKSIFSSVFQKSDETTSPEKKDGSLETGISPPIHSSENIEKGEPNVEKVNIRIKLNGILQELDGSYIELLQERYWIEKALSMKKYYIDYKIYKINEKIILIGELHSFSNLSTLRSDKSINSFQRSSEDECMDIEAEIRNNELARFNKLHPNTLNKIKHTELYKRIMFGLL